MGRILGIVFFVLLIPFLLLAFLYVWRKQAAQNGVVSANGNAPQGSIFKMFGTSAPQPTPVAPTSQTAQIVAAAAPVAAPVVKALTDWIASDSTYTPDYSEIQSVGWSANNPLFLA